MGERLSNLRKHGPEHILYRLPPRLAAWIDFARPLARRSQLPWAAPLNGQELRQQTVRELLACMSFQAIVETGTFRGTTTEFLRRESRLPIHTVEVNPRYYHYARRRFRKDEDVRVACGDSRDFLRECASDPQFPRERVFFYLDAHWGGTPPLREEVVMVAETWSEWVIMIDDFKVPHDPGYGFADHYEFEFALEALPLEQMAPCRVFWPSAPSDQETGSRRGCVVIAAEGRICEEIDMVASLQEL